MPAWSWFIVAVILGGALLALAALADRRSRRRATGADEPAPRRGLDDVDRPRSRPRAKGSDSGTPMQTSRTTATAPRTASR